MIHFQLVSTTGTKFDSEVYEVLVPTQAGIIALFENHMPLISAAMPGVISVRKQASDKDDEMQEFAVSGGVVQVDNKNARFIADEVTTSEDVSEAEAEAALARAQDLMANANSQVAIHEAKRLVQRSSARLHVARLKKRHHN
jgi:F-type H+-transporting ATPase subunit epsilon